VNIYANQHHKKVFFDTKSWLSKKQRFTHGTRDYRIICKIEGKTITILVLDIGHRKEIYK
jgi:mRNA-degrading endonuclease RelE of RelBE toxin-antitoxin system